MNYPPTLHILGTDARFEPLTEDQRQRLAVLGNLQALVTVEWDVWDLIRAAHWVYSGTELPVSDDGIEIGSKDEERWAPVVARES